MFLFNIIVLDSGVIFKFDPTFYCPQTTPDYLIDYIVTLQFDTTFYCPQTIPDYSFLTPP